MTPDVLETPPAGGATVRRSPGPCPDAASLDDECLLGLLLRSVSGDSDRLAAALLERFGSLGGVVSADAGELRRVLARKPDGLVLLDLAREFAIRLAREGARRRTDITSWTELRAYVRTMMAHRPREQFFDALNWAMAQWPDMAHCRTLCGRMLLAFKPVCEDGPS